MSGLIYLNGEIVPSAEARISPFDRGFLYGDGLFETMRVSAGAAPLLDRHLDRLERSAAMIGIRPPARALLADAVARTVAANDAGHCVLRLTVSRGQAAGWHPDPDAPPTILASVRPLASAHDLEAQHHLVTLETPHARQATEVAVKGTSYLPSVLGALELGRRGAAEGVLITREGMVAEGTVSNLFCVIDGALVTPPLELGVLPGVARARVLELARERGVETRERTFDRAALASAAECFTTNAARGVLPALTLDAAQFGDGRPGPVTLLLADLLLRELEGR